MEAVIPWVVEMLPHAIHRYRSLRCLSNSERKRFNFTTLRDCPVGTGWPYLSRTILLIPSTNKVAAFIFTWLVVPQKAISGHAPSPRAARETCTEWCQAALRDCDSPLHSGTALPNFVLTPVRYFFDAASKKDLFLTLPYHVVQVTKSGTDFTRSVERVDDMAWRRVPCEKWIFFVLSCAQKRRISYFLYSTSPYLSALFEITCQNQLAHTFPLLFMACNPFVERREQGISSTKCGISLYF